LLQVDPFLNAGFTEDMMAASRSFLESESMEKLA